MLSKYTNIILVLFLLFLSKSFVIAQNNYSFSDKWGVGANIGLNYFYGDVSDDKGRIWNNAPLSGFYYTDKNFMASLSLTKAINKLWGIRSYLAYGKLSGSDEGKDMYFKSAVYSMDMDVTFQYLDYFLNRPETSKFKYYAYAGFGMFKFNSIRRKITTDQLIDTNGINNNGESIKPIVKLGLGIAYQLDKKWLFHFETTLYYTNSDYLDDFKSSSSKLEGFGYMSLGFIYKFNLNLNLNLHSGNDLWEKSKGTNNRTYNSGLKNKKKRKLHNKWKK
jgi:hypothetical protein